MEYLQYEWEQLHDTDTSVSDSDGDGAGIGAIAGAKVRKSPRDAAAGKTMGRLLPMRELTQVRALFSLFYR